MLQLLATPFDYLGRAGYGTKGSLTAADIALLREVEALMPIGAAAEPLVTAEGHPQQHWFPSQLAGAPAVPNGMGGGACGSRTEVRRAADAVQAELQQYFEAHRGDKWPNARTVLGGRLARWAAEARERDPALSSIRWWCDFLCRVEDSRPFTKSNWANASAFEDALSRCRLVLVSLRGRLADGEGHEDLRGSLERAHRASREAADKLLELLYVALRPRPAATRCCFHDLETLALAPATAGSAFEAKEDRLIFLILGLERADVVDALAPAFLDQALVEECEASATLPAEVANALHESEVMVRQLRGAWSSGDCEATRVPATVTRALGQQTLDGFIELHGHYCLLAGLLQRVELLLQAMQSYASFVCFLPVYQAAVLDLEVLLPQLRLKICTGVGGLAAAYESLPRPIAPQGRTVVLDKCASLIKQLQHSEAPAACALAALKSCSPTRTLRDFDVWRSGDQRWLQVARLNLTAHALLPEAEIDALAVPRLVENLRSGGCGYSEQLCLQDDATSSELRPLDDAAVVAQLAMCKTGGPASQGLCIFVDEDTRLHQAGRAIGALGMQVTASAAAVPRGWCVSLSQAILEQVSGLLPQRGAVKAVAGDAATRAASIIVEYLGPRPLEDEFTAARHLFEESEWTLVGEVVHPDSSHAIGKQEDMESAT